MSEIREHWLDRAVEDKLGEIIDKYRLQGKDVHNVGALRNRVDADLNALRGTSQWAALKQRYDPTPQNRVAWCCVCDKPVNRGSVSAWLTDARDNVFCGSECKANTQKHPINYSEYRRRVREAGSMTSRRKSIVDGQVVLGDEFTITWAEIKDQRLPAGFIDLPDTSSVTALSVDDGVDWDE